MMSAISNRRAESFPARPGPSRGSTERGAVFQETLLPEGKNRLRSFGAGFFFECTIVAALVLVPLFMPQKFQAAQRYWVTSLTVPHVEPWKPQPRPKAKPAIKREVARPKPVEAVVVPKPRIYTPVFSSPIQQRVRRVNTPKMKEVAEVLPKPSMSIGSSAIPDIKRPRAPVQTGGFGDPNGAPGPARPTANPNIEHVGSFDLPPGPGYGNGTGGAKGVRGVVASSGFGNEVATGGGGARHGTVQQGLFADQHAVAAAPHAKSAAAASGDRQVQVLGYPRPAYTDEARAKKIEGDVLLQCVFLASGQVIVQKVVRGLGSGLDASAEEAARQIRFRPAEQGGQPVDSPPVTVHIRFQLAY